jgi:hypothetical protein
MLFFGLPGSHNDINVLECNLYFLTLFKGVLLLLTTPLMVITIIWDSTSLMAYIHSGRHL